MILFLWAQSHYLVLQQTYTYKAQKLIVLEQNENVRTMGYLKINRERGR